MAQLNAKQSVSQNYGLGGSHSRSSSQPQFFSNNCLPPLSPLHHSESSLASSSSIKDVSMEEMDVSSQGPASVGSSYRCENAFRGNFESLPPRKGHRRSNSDVPLGFNAMIQTSPQLVPISGQGVLGKSSSGNNKFALDKPIRLQMLEMDTFSDTKNHVEGIGDRKLPGEVVEDLFQSYMNLEKTDRFSGSSSGSIDKGSTFSSTKRSGGNITNNEGENISKRNDPAIEGMDAREGIKRSAAGDIAPTPRHFRSLSVDSAFGNLNFGDESPKFPPSSGNGIGQFSPSNLMNENMAKLSLDYGNGEFSDAEVKKIMSDERLAEIALSDPKRAKRILANRQSAARSKERKLRYICELEHKVQTLQTEATTLSAQLTILQKDFTELTNQNNELKFRLKAMEQQAQLRDALHEALTGEVQRLKLVAAEFTENGGSSSRTMQQMPMKHHMLQMQQRHPSNQRQQIPVSTSKTSTTSSATPASA
ncbi:hypothetical protein M9H77_24936 [Catharanthus roseus]|uniref:Uncharacterized protein n=1 Tax=Catharanthus roseus TaxID=4058 RepID=A0ACC0A5H1_CATRO|nr:hypothetical protein M9H77_24936 [Catharanthus roseus]